MINLVRGGADGHYWPLVVAALVTVYWLSPEDAWPVLTFVFLAMTYLTLAFARMYEYFYIIRTQSNLLFAIAHIFFAIALLLSAFQVAPDPVADFSWMRPFSRSAWAIGLPFFVVAVHYQVWWMYEVVRAREEI